MAIKWKDRYEQLGHLPEFTLYSLATNESAPLNYRKTALEIMLQKGYKSAENPIFRGLGLEFEVLDTPEEHQDTVITVDMFEKMAEKLHGSGPLQASVTTKAMFGDPETPPFIPDYTQSFQKTDE